MTKIVCPEPGAQLTIGSTTAPIQEKAMTAPDATPRTDEFQRRSDALPHGGADQYGDQSMLVIDMLTSHSELESALAAVQSKFTENDRCAVCNVTALRDHFDGKTLTAHCMNCGTVQALSVHMQVNKALAQAESANAQLREELAIVILGRDANDSVCPEGYSEVGRRNFRIGDLLQQRDKLRAELAAARACIRSVNESGFYGQWLKEHAPAIEAAKEGT